MSWLSTEAGSEMRTLCERDDEQFKHRVRMWKARKALAWAKQGLHRARVRLTQLRHAAYDEREELARSMFAGGGSIADVALAVLAQVRAEESSVDRARWISERDYYQEKRREWLVLRRHWVREIRGVNERAM